LDPELQRAGLAVAIGLLIGIERGWQERQERSGWRVAGIRTYTLIGTLGGICGLLARTSPLALSLCFFGFAIPFGILEWRRIRHSNNFSATNFVAGLLTFALGAYAAVGDMLAAAAGAVVSAAVLAERRVLHGFLRRLRWAELRGAIVLLVLTVVLLPVLPDRTIDPWNALNPHQIWLMTVLVGAVCYAGYVAIRLAGPDKGLLFGGVTGGLITSTTVTWTFARMARHDPTLRDNVLAAILAAWVVSLIRMTILAVAIAPSLLMPLTIPITASAGFLTVATAVAYRFAARAHPHALALRDPLELSLMLRFCVLLVAIMLLSKLATARQVGLLTLGGLSGVVDVDPITLSMAGLADKGIAARLAAETILVAAAANGLAKAILAQVFGGWRLGSILGAAVLCAILAGAAGFTVGLG
jgi:uncharacterized membrane protein (DUF4010 family)